MFTHHDDECSVVGNKLILMDKSGPDSTIYYRPYVGESDLPSIMALVQSELSEPYVIYTYRYFLRQW